MRSRGCPSVRDERGEVSAWLITAAGLVAAAVLASAILQTSTQRLADEVAFAAGMPDAASAEPDVDTLRHALRHADRLPVDDTTTFLDIDGLPGVVRERDGLSVSVTVDENGYFHLLKVDADGNVERYVARVNERGELHPGGPEADGRVIEQEGHNNIIDTIETWHYEDRDARNTNLPANLTAVRALASDGWFMASPDQAAYHQDPSTPGVDLKFVHPDGREAVYNRLTGELVRDPAYAGTYNYVHMPNKPKEWHDIAGWANWAIRGIGHLVVDVIPWKIGGSYRGDGGGESEQDKPDKESTPGGGEAQPNCGCPGAGTG